MDHAITIGGLVWFLVGAAVVIGIGGLAVWVLSLYAKGMSR